MGHFLDFPKRIWANETFRMLFIAAGIIICFLYFGIMQEKIMRGCFGGKLVEGKCIEGEKYEFEITLVGTLALVYATVARIILQIQSPQPDKTRQGWYAAAAFTYLSAMVCGNMALRWIIYPTQVIAKSSKPIPVMLVGVLLANKRYRVQKYFFVLMIVIGVIMFIYKEGKAKEEDANNHIGLILVGMSLLSDGVLGAIEDRIRAATRPSTFNFMFSVNMYSAVFLTVATCATGEIFKFFEFASKHSDVYLKIGSAAVIGSVGQIFIFMMISEFGPLSCSIVTTTRKFFTVLISVIFMGNPLTTRQKLAIGIVFTALFADALWSKKQLCGKQEVIAIQTGEPDIEKNESSTKDAADLQDLEKKKESE